MANDVVRNFWGKSRTLHAVTIELCNQHGMLFLKYAYHLLTPQKSLLISLPIFFYTRRHKCQRISGWQSRLYQP